MGMDRSLAIRLDRPRAAAAFGSPVYIPNRPSHYPPQRPAQRRSTPREARPAHYVRSVTRPVAQPQPQASFLAAFTFALKLVAAALAAAVLTLFLTKTEPRRDLAMPEIATVQMPSPAQVAANGVSTQYRTPAAARPDAFDPDRGIPANWPRRVQTISFFAPPQAVAALPASAPAAAPRTATAPVPASPAPAPKVAALTPPNAPLTAPSPSTGNELAGKPLRYLIGGSAGTGSDKEVTMVSYSTNAPVAHGISIAYGNLFEETKTGKYGPYLNTSDTARQYNEGQIDPRGPGWEKNLREQFERRRKAGFHYIELDNPDAYKIKDVIGAIDLAATYGLKVIAKNPGITDDPVTYVKHPNVVGIIVEKGAGNAADMDALRRKAGKPDLPVWFVSFGSGRAWGNSVAAAAKNYQNMGVTYSSAGEYGNVIHLHTPNETTRAAAAR
jgi:hypothetical protein